MKKLMALVLSVFMFVGVPFPVYASEQFAEPQNTEVETVTNPDDSEMLSPEDKQEDKSSRNESDIEIKDIEEQPQQEVQEVVNYGVNYTNVGKLNPPVSGPKLQPRFKTMSLAAAATTAVDENDSVLLNKNAVYQDDNTVEITLEAFATGMVTSVINDVPADIVLVLDQSGSMKESLNKNTFMPRTYTNAEAYSRPVNTLYTFVNNEYVRVTVVRAGNKKNYTYTYTYTSKGVQTTISSGGQNDASKPAPLPLYSLVSEITRLEALKKEVKTFIDAVYQKSLGIDNLPNTADDLKHRISVLGFASGETSSIKYNNTEILSLSALSGSPINYANKTDASLKNSLLDTVANKTQLDRAVTWLDAEGATRSDLGMEMAKSVLLQNPIPAGETRQRIVILFTDGTPTSSSLFDATVANAAIGYSKTIKSESIGATTYTIGIMNEANPAATDNVNKYMNYVSSNYPNAESLTNPGSGTYTSGYYLSANNSEALGNIFSQISSQVGGANNQNLTSETTVKDVLSPQLMLPDDFNVDDVNVQVYDYVGISNDYSLPGSWQLTNPQPTDIEVYFDSVTGTVDVSGFDYSQNYVAYDAVAKKATGKKLVITFTAAVKEDFIGGNIVNTNNAESGIYAPDGTGVKNFVVPEVDIPLRLDASSVNKGIYLSQSISANELISGDGLNYKINGTDYRIDGINNAYSDIRYVLYDRDGTTELRSFTIKAGETSITDDSNANIPLSETGEFKLAMFLIPANEGSVPQKITELQSKVYVWKPSVQAMDTTMWWGETTDLNARVNFVDWVNNEVGAVSPDSDRTQPVLDFEPVLMDGEAVTDETAYAPEFDATFNIKLNIDGVDYTDRMILQKADSAMDMNFDFTVFVKKASLTIVKELQDNSAMDPNQSFIFNVNGPTGNYQIAMQGETSKTIEGLKLGAYTVNEVTDWSWRYQVSDINVNPATAEASADIENGTKIALSAANNEVTITFINEKANTKWFSGESFSVNLFGQAKQLQAILNSRREEDGS